FAATLEKRYGVKIRFYLPSNAAVESLVDRQGPNGFRVAVDQRKACCAVRKVAPLERALSGKRSWITGLRRGQSGERASTEPVGWNAYHSVWKYAPLADWTAASVWTFVRAAQIPYHPLYERGYASIGCASCTRAITPGEDERAGRWWWEAPGAGKECGLHTAAAEQPVEWQI
ncbi:MAG: phosphoadenylyl-sulfate reductase, partial [Pseudomonadota bacterium]|nr:phosphoadenylyl-sulfate reductase [Pseudomonadota bacterium]